ncbi:KUP/HAK/KT family potassium transporter [Brevibacterium sp. ZH18]|uniref:KUP/HAK/KT family potassium transporter n=1 Tax=Brevibacterium sp. ZH18 TaxID=2927784 RepID=UPI001F605CCD|nr:KUP/HAK/KT family potassium transporter [Brevibacterium sp. ZH18]MCI4010047.1 KUP/HAK/KT family potassium transporter [Brevibacterium sp. ZH18]
MTSPGVSLRKNHRGTYRPEGPHGFPLLVSALGIVFGDIGTSPLYSFSAVLAAIGHPSRLVIFGTTSMIIWSIILIVTVLYVGILLRRDNDGEGGLLSLYALFLRSGPSRRATAIAALVAIVGAALFFGDSIITPAISVLSAVEGLTSISPGLSVVIVPVAVTILVVLFLTQRFGTAVIGRFFGPVMLLWFAMIAVLGLVSVLADPSVLVALSPHWIVLLVAAHPWTAFVALTGVVLAITGAEALFADMGHFGRLPISRAWFAIVLPSLVLNYLGQAGLVLRTPGKIGHPFFGLVPGWAMIPAVVLATLATVIASQAVIAAAFSAVQQAGRLQLLPPFAVVRVSQHSPGQIYVPLVNLLLAIAVIAVTIAFGSSVSLAAAYGIAVTVSIMATTTVLTFFLLHQRRLFSPAGVFALVALAVVALFVISNLTKFVSGGWLPIAIGLVISMIMYSWRSGQQRLLEARRADHIDLDAFVSSLAGPDAPTRLPGTAVYLCHSVKLVPAAMQTMIRHQSVLHERVLIVKIMTGHKPFSTEARVTELGYGVSTIELEVGFSLPPKVPALLNRVAQARTDFKKQVESESVTQAGTEKQPQPTDAQSVADAVYFVSEVAPYPGENSPMHRWQRVIFINLMRLRPDLLNQYHLPRDHSIVLNREVPI